jgi:hypothetical protein
VECVISNGVINLSPDKAAVFAAAAKALRPGRPRRIEESVVLSKSHFARLQLTPTARMPLKCAGPTLNVGQTRASAGEDWQK